MTDESTPKDGTLKSVAYWLREHDLHSDLLVDAMEFNRPDIEEAARAHVDEATEKLISTLREFLFKNGVYPWPKS